MAKAPLVIDQSKYNSESGRKTMRSMIYRAVYEGRGWRYASSRASTVWTKTNGSSGLSRGDLTINSSGKVVSRRKSMLGKQLYRENEAMQEQTRMMRASR